MELAVDGDIFPDPCVFFSPFPSFGVSIVVNAATIVDSRFERSLESLDSIVFAPIETKLMAETRG